MVDLLLGESRISGTGCYAGRAFAKGEIVAEYTGERLTEAEADARYPVQVATYLFVTDDRTVIDATDDPNPAKYINHSCDPNCETIERDGRIFIRALREIAEGEELSYDYNLESEDEEPCSCGSLNCRGTMKELE